MPGDRLRRILAELSDGESMWPAARLCAVGPQITGSNGVGVMLMSGDIPSGSLCSSDEVSQLIEELQYTLGEGPCVEAYQQDKIVSEPDLADPRTRRWLAFTPPVLEDVTARWVLDAQAGAPAGVVAEQLEAGADFHFAVHNAAGIVSIQEGITVTEALIRLRAFAYGNDRLLADVAQDVIAHRLRLG